MPAVRNNEAWHLGSVYGSASCKTSRVSRHQRSSNTSYSRPAPLSREGVGIQAALNGGLCRNLQASKARPRFRASLVPRSQPYTRSTLTSDSLSSGPVSDFNSVLVQFSKPRPPLASRRLVWGVGWPRSTLLYTWLAGSSPETLQNRVHSIPA